MHISINHSQQQPIFFLLLRLFVDIFFAFSWAKKPHFVSSSKQANKKIRVLLCVSWHTRTPTDREAFEPNFYKSAFMRQSWCVEYRFISFRWTWKKLRFIKDQTKFLHSFSFVFRSRGLKLLSGATKGWRIYSRLRGVLTFRGRREGEQ